MTESTKWEYLVRVYADRDPASQRIMEEHFARSLNYQGHDGWELVSLLPGEGPSLAVPVIRCVFKRPKLRGKPNEGLEGTPDADLPS